MKNKNNKKPLVAVGMGLAIALVALAGVSTANSFAKYVTNGKYDSNPVTVAKWGVGVTVDADKMFGEKYDKDTATTSAVGGNGVSVKAEELVVAPGTHGEMSIVITGKPEVASQVKVAATSTSEIHLDTYYPVVWSIGDTVVGKLSDLVTALEGDTYNKTFNAGDKVDNTIKISWSWAFSSEGNDAKDTILGDMAADPEYKLPSPYTTENTSISMSFTIDVTVEQIIK